MGGLVQKAGHISRWPNDSDPAYRCLRFEKPIDGAVHCFTHLPDYACPSHCSPLRYICTYSVVPGSSLGVREYRVVVAGC